MEIIREQKVKLINWLCGDELILQHVHSRNLITETEYTRIKSVQDPYKQVTELMDLILKKGENTCIQFLELLKKDNVNESSPELRKWITTVNIPDERNSSNTAPAAHAEAAVHLPDNQAFLKNNRSNLIEKVKNVDGIVDDLNFTDEKAANVRALQTEQAKMRKVLEYTTSKKAAQCLVDALYKHAPDVMEDLTAA